MRMGNQTRTYVLGCVYHLAYIVITGSILQTFMLESGIPEKQVSLFVSLLQVMILATNMLCAGAIDRRKSLARLYGMMFLLNIPMYLAMAVICLVPSLPADVKFILFLVTGIISGVSSGAIGVIGCKIPYLTIDMTQYGRIAAVTGISEGITGMIFVALISVWLRQRSYFTGMFAVCMAGLVLTLICMILAFGFRENRLGENVTEAPKKINLFRYPPFYKLLIPNLLRGYVGGTFGLMATVGYYLHRIDSTGGTYMAIIADVLTIAGCLSYMLVVRWKKTKQMILICGIGIALSMSLILAGRSGGWFLALYGVLYFFIGIFNYAIPVAVTQIVDYEVMGQYTSWRLGLHALGSAIAGATCISLMEIFGGTAVMVMNGIMMLIAAVTYYVMMIRMDKKGELKF